MRSNPQRAVAILGSTGSIGCNALDVIASLPERFTVVALAAGDNIALLASQVAQFHPRVVAVRTADKAQALRTLLGAGSPQPEILHGPEGLLAVATASGATLVVAATVGVAALPAIHAALAQGCDCALANKEALVVAGAVLLAAAKASGAALLPIDSEHSAIHQCLRAGQPREIARLVLTASGGPFLRTPAGDLARVTPKAALQHPTWSMGARITLDSATMMNKGFEVIEACHLFGLEQEQVDVLVHPQSIVHSMVEFVDGSCIAQLGTADMRTPIQYALTYPERLASSRMRLNLEEAGRLEFEAPDLERFPCLRLAREAWRAGAGAPAVLNAADEVAVKAFRDGAIGFTDIPRVIAACLDKLGAPVGASLDDVLDTDRRARQVANDRVLRV